MKENKLERHAWDICANGIEGELYQFTAKHMDMELPHQVIGDALEKFGDRLPRDRILDIVVSAHTFMTEIDCEWDHIEMICLGCENYKGRYDNLPSLAQVPFCKVSDRLTGLKCGQRTC